MIWKRKIKKNYRFGFWLSAGSEVKAKSAKFQCKEKNFKKFLKNCKNFGKYYNSWKYFLKFIHEKEI